MSDEKRIEGLSLREGERRGDGGALARTAERRGPAPIDHERDVARAADGSHSSGIRRDAEAAHSAIPSRESSREPVRDSAREPARDSARGQSREPAAEPAHEPGREPAPESGREPRHRVPQRDILNIDEAAELLGVSVKTFNKVLHGQNMPARKIGREWKFSRQALIDWVGSGRSQEFYRESSDDDDEPSVELEPPGFTPSERPKSRRTAGWQIEMD